MEDTFEITGLKLHNECVGDFLAWLREHGWPTFMIIEEITSEMIFAAAADAKLKELLKSVDYAIPYETCLLWATGQKTALRAREIDEHEFYYGLMNYVQEQQKTVFLLGQSSEELEDTKAGILRDFPECKIVGMEALEKYQGETDSVVNCINGETPDMVLSVLPTPEQEYFLRENKSMLCMNLWYGIGRVRRHRKQKGFFALIRHYILVYRLRNLIAEEEKREKKEHL